MNDGAIAVSAFATAADAKFAGRREDEPRLPEDFERRFIFWNAQPLSRRCDHNVEGFWFEVLVERRLENLVVHVVPRPMRCLASHRFDKALRATAVKVGALDGCGRSEDTSNRRRSAPLER